jgi:hypothetical protein
MTNLTNIGNFAGFEFGTFKLKEGVSEEKLLQLANDTDKKFMANEDGFLGHAVLRGEDGIYADIAFATTQEKAQEICGKWMKNEYALKYIDVIEPESVNMSFWSRIK